MSLSAERVLPHGSARLTEASERLPREHAALAHHLEAVDGDVGPPARRDDVDAPVAGAAIQERAVLWHQREQPHAGHAKKAAVTNALKAALARLAIIRFRSGKVVVRQLVPDEPCGAENCAPQSRPQQNVAPQSRQVPEDVD